MTTLKLNDTQKLNEDNFLDWSILVEAHLMDNEMYGALHLEKADVELNNALPNNEIWRLFKLHVLTEESLGKRHDFEEYVNLVRTHEVNAKSIIKEDVQALHVSKEKKCSRC
eukprot:Awhi_evm1s14333